MQPIISIPKHWNYPRFALGERTQQGIIVGIEYYPTDSQLAYQYGQGWRYAVMPNKNSDELFHYQEDQIQTLSLPELSSPIQAELEQHQRQVTILQQQLVAVKGGRTDA